MKTKRYYIYIFLITVFAPVIPVLSVTNDPSALSKISVVSLIRLLRYYLMGFSEKNYVLQWYTFLSLMILIITSCLVTIKMIAVKVHKNEQKETLL